MPAKPTIEQLREIAQTYDLHLSDADLESFTGLMGAVLESYRRMDQLTQPALPVSYQRSGGYRPSAEENPLNAWYQKCSIKGAASGILAGKRIAIKDNVCVAGVPMMNGSSVLESYVPEFDATIVTRILDAGGEIVGKAVCEHLCFSGSSFTSDSGPVRNPHDPTRTAGERNLVWRTGQGRRQPLFPRHQDSQCVGNRRQRGHHHPRGTVRLCGAGRNLRRHEKAQPGQPQGQIRHPLACARRP